MTQPRNVALHSSSSISLTTCPTALRVLRCKSRSTKKKASLRFPSFRSNPLWYIRHFSYSYFYLFFTNAWVGLRRTTVDQAHIMWNTAQKRKRHAVDEATEYWKEVKKEKKKKGSLLFWFVCCTKFIPENFWDLGDFRVHCVLKLCFSCFYFLALLCLLLFSCYPILSYLSPLVVSACVIMV